LIAVLMHVLEIVLGALRNELCAFVIWVG
jgi:hypothetical protein